MEFDKKKFLQLLNEKEELKVKGQLYNFDKDKALKLNRYFELIESQIHWDDRFRYFQILELFGKSKITYNEFADQFYELWNANQQTFRMLKKKFEQESSGILSKSNKIDFKFNSKSIEFEKIISSIQSYINICDPGVSLKMNLDEPDLITYGMSPDFFKSIVLRNLLPKLKKYCKE